MTYASYCSGLALTLPTLTVTQATTAPPQSDLFKGFLDRFSQLDTKSRIQDTIWSRYRTEVRSLVESEYLFGPYWQYKNGAVGYDEWRKQFDSHIARYHDFTYDTDTEAMLYMLFNCLYVLRNQLFHGGATWKGGVNRQQVEDGVAIIGYMLPLFVEIMLDNPECDWGEPFYCVQDKRPYSLPTSG